MGQLTQLNLTPHPVLLDGQRTAFVSLHPGESLYAFLMRNVDGLDGQQWHVSIGGHDVPRHLWHRVRPKDGQVIEVRGALGNNVLQLVAMVALTYFTFGAGATWAGALGATGFGATAVYGAAFLAGSMLINSVLGPKLPSVGTQSKDSVYSIGAARNTARPNEPFGLVFGEVRSTPDYISAPYTYYMGNDQYVAMTLTPGLNCQQIGDLYNGDTLLSSFDGVEVWYSGFPGMPQQDIPLYGNADTLDGGALDDANVWVERTTSPGTMSVMLNYSYVLFDTTTKGSPKNNQEDITAEYRPTGSSGWLALATTHVVSKVQTEQRKTVEFTFPQGVGQYDIRVKRNGNDTDGKGAHIQMSWTTLNSIQPDTGDYTGIPRIGLRIKATGQLNGYPDEIRGVVKAEPIQVWTAGGWATATTRDEGLSNPGAQLLAYARGLSIQTAGGPVRYAGLGLTEDMIDLDALKAFMLHCTANGFTYDYIVKDAKSHDDVCNTIALAGMGQISWAGGKFSVVWAADDQPISGVVNMATIKKASFNVDYSLVSAADGIEYSYFDRLTWETKTVIVRAPGVAVMLNPAKVSGEGISDADHAAKMARYHLGQSLYQFKSIGFNTDLEHLTYRRMSVLQLAHDMTQWGYGGRLVGGTRNGDTVTLHLDEPVPPPALGNAWIGVRVLGETVYRVLAVQPFAAETNQITLAEPWPSDADFPGEDFPAHDSIWIYDFKQTPGYRVRVVNIEPESDLKGARISVVPESDEFWTYVLTGEYTPPTQGTSLNVRPVVSNVRVSEQNNVQGNTVYTTLSVIFDVDGDMQYAAVLAQDNASPTDELVEVAQTQSRTASFRIPGPGTYAIMVRPYDRNGIAGGASSIVYTTISAQPAPILFDVFEISEDPSGVRRYSWGYAADTIQSPDLLGAEIRYVAGDVPLPNWDSMQPLGDGYHTGPFESVIPVAGQWTFAIRARNTSGILSPDMRVLSKALQYNLAQKIDETNSQIAQEIIDRFNADAEAADALAAEAQTRANEIAAQAQALANEAQTRANEIAAAADAAAADATAKADAARDAAIAHADVIGAQVADITGADDWVVGASYPDGDLVKYMGTLYRALRANTGAQPDISPLDWEPIGNYASLGEAVAASIDMGTQNASDLAAESTRLDGVVATIPTLATVASVTDETTARVNADNAMSSRVGVVEARMPTGTDLLANEARVVTVENASVSRDDALGSRVTTVEATLPTLATTASVTNLSNSMVSADNALAQDITAANTRIDGKADTSALNSLSSTVTQQGNTLTSQGQSLTDVQARIGVRPNLIMNPSFQNGMDGWNSTGLSFGASSGVWGPVATWGGSAFTGTVVLDSSKISVAPSTWYTASADLMNIGASDTACYIDIVFLDSAGVIVLDSDQNSVVGSMDYDASDTRRNTFAIEAQSPSNAVDVVVRAVFLAKSAIALGVRRFKLERGRLPNTIYSEDAFGYSEAQATTALTGRVTTAEGRIDSQSTQVTSLQNSLTTTNNNVTTAQNTADNALSVANTKADSSVVQALDSRVTSVEGVNTSQGSSITSLNNSLTTVTNDVNGLKTSKADASALNSLSSTVTQQGNTISSQGTEITQVQSRIGVRPNMIKNPSFQNGLVGWSTAGVSFGASSGVWGPVATWGGSGFTGTVIIQTEQIVVAPNAWYTASADLLNFSDANGYCFVDMLFYDTSGNVVADSNEHPIYGSINFDDTDTRRNTFAVEWLAPSNAATVTVRALFSASNATALGARRFKLEFGRLPNTIYSEDAFGAAGAAATTALSATVTQQGNTISSHSGQITSLQNDVAGKAESSALNALSSTVTQQGDTISSHSGQITSLQNDVAGKAESSALNALSSTVTQQGDTISSQGAALTSVSSKITADRGNLLPYGGFQNGVTGWYATNANISAYDNAEWGRVLSIGPTNVDGNVVSDLLPAVGGAPYILTGEMAYYASSGNVSFGIVFFNGSGQIISAATGSSKQPNFSMAEYSRDAFQAYAPSAPEGTTHIRVYINFDSVTGFGAFEVRRIKLERGTLPASQYTTEAAEVEGAFATQSLTTRATTNENNIASVLAQYFLSVQAGNLIGGMKIGNNGSVVDFAILANIFRIVDPSNSANLLSYVNGNLTVSGIVEGSLLKSSALELGSTRIHVGSGRLAPFTINDSAFNLLDSNAVASQTVTVSGFVGPANGSGYNAKRFSRQKMDVYLKVLIAADDGDETLAIEVQYDGGGWTAIQSYPFDGNNRTTIQIALRYTTNDSWSTVAFRARTSQVHTNMLSLEMEVNNTNESGNEAGSNSGLNSSGGAGGSAPPANGGGGTEFCVDYETTVLPDGRYVRDLQVGDLVECVDVMTGERSLVPLRAMGFGTEGCYAVRTVHGEVIQSRSTPMDMRDGSVKRTSELQGRELLTHAHGWEVASIEYLGERKVCKPDFGNRMFFAGTSAVRTIATHNIQYKP